MDVFSIEVKILRHLVRAALANGLVCSVFDGEETTVVCSADYDVIIDALRSTDQDALRFYATEPKIKHVGTVVLIYGNAHDVMSDWSESLDALPWFQAVLEYAASYEESAP